MPQRLCIPLPEAPGATAAGGKAASLGELIRAGLRVPPGFVVTAGAFAAAMAQLDPGGRLRAGIGALSPDDLAGIMATAGQVRQQVTAAPVPGQVAAAITTAYADLAASVVPPGGTVPGYPPLVAVRSSATMEDSAQDSFAGLQDTYLAIRGADGLLEAVSRCWASLYNDESVGYRRRAGLPEPSLAMAVVVQVMVSPRAAGVMFTRSPVTGDRSVVAIEATWGLGSALVAGDVTPDSFTISKVTGEITARRISSKAITHSLSPNGTGHGVTETPAGRRDEPCLTDSEIRALASVARQVEAHYGIPQDIEWAILDPEGAPAADRLVVLQSRPETAWAARDAARAAPAATRRPRAADHVVSLFGRPANAKGTRWS
jgi:pyruvate,water dikinase